MIAIKMRNVLILPQDISVVVNLATHSTIMDDSAKVDHHVLVSNRITCSIQKYCCSLTTGKNFRNKIFVYLPECLLGVLGLHYSIFHHEAVRNQGCSIILKNLYNNVPYPMKCSALIKWQISHFGLQPYIRSHRFSSFHFCFQISTSVQKSLRVQRMPSVLIFLDLTNANVIPDSLEMDNLARV